MEQKDKELLLKDLCARLPYGIKVQVEYDAEEFGKTIETDEITMINKYGEVLLYHASEYFIIEEIKPYLRPMSSMTEEENLMYEGLMIGTDNVSYMLDAIDWLNAHHFDYRGLIDKGLALEAPDGMYKFE